MYLVSVQFEIVKCRTIYSQNMQQLFYESISIRFKQKRLVLLDRSFRHRYWEPCSARVSDGLDAADSESNGFVPRARLHVICSSPKA